MNTKHLLGLKSFRFMIYTQRVLSWLKFMELYLIQLQGKRWLRRERLDQIWNCGIRTNCLLLTWIWTWRSKQVLTWEFLYCLYTSLTLQIRQQETLSFIRNLKDLQKLNTKMFKLCYLYSEVLDLIRPVKDRRIHLEQANQLQYRLLINLC